MSVALHVWAADGADWVITAPTYGKAYDLATEAGAVRAVDCHGMIDRRIGGEWVGIGQERQPDQLPLPLPRIIRQGDSS